MFTILRCPSTHYYWILQTGVYNTEVPFHTLLLDTSDRCLQYWGALPHITTGYFRQVFTILRCPSSHYYWILQTCVYNTKVPFLTLLLDTSDRCLQYWGALPHITTGYFTGVYNTEVPFHILLLDTSDRCLQYWGALPHITTGYFRQVFTILRCPSHITTGYFTGVYNTEVPFHILLLDTSDRCLQYWGALPHMTTGYFRQVFTILRCPSHITTGYFTGVYNTEVPFHILLLDTSDRCLQYWGALPHMTTGYFRQVFTILRCPSHITTGYFTGVYNTEVPFHILLLDTSDRCLQYWGALPHMTTGYFRQVFTILRCPSHITTGYFTGVYNTEVPFHILLLDTSDRCLQYWGALPHMTTGYFRQVFTILRCPSHITTGYFTGVYNTEVPFHILLLDTSDRCLQYWGALPHMTTGYFRQVFTILRCPSHITTGYFRQVFTILRCPSTHYYWILQTGVYNTEVPFHTLLLDTSDRCLQYWGALPHITTGYFRQVFTILRCPSTHYYWILHRCLQYWGALPHITTGYFRQVLTLLRCPSTHYYWILQTGVYNTEVPFHTLLLDISDRCLQYWGALHTLLLDTSDRCLQYWGALPHITTGYFRQVFTILRCPSTHYYWILHRCLQYWGALPHITTGYFRQVFTILRCPSHVTTGYFRQVFTILRCPSTHYYWILQTGVYNTEVPFHTLLLDTSDRCLQYWGALPHITTGYFRQVFTILRCPSTHYYWILQTGVYNTEVPFHTLLLDTSDRCLQYWGALPHITTGYFRQVFTILRCPSTHYYWILQTGVYNTEVPFHTLLLDTSDRCLQYWGALHTLLLDISDRCLQYWGALHTLLLDISDRCLQYWGALHTWLLDTSSKGKMHTSF